MDRFDGQLAVVVGGGSGIGRAMVERLVGLGGAAIIASRSADKLARVAEEIGPAVTARPLDMTDTGAVEAWAEALPEVDHLVISASSAAHGPFRDLPMEDLRGMFEAKFFGPYQVAKAVLPKLRAGGSLTFFSGVLSRRPGANCSGLGAVNGAVESLTYALALELGPDLRVNCVSPGMVRSEAYAGLPEAAREAMYRDTGASLPLGRVGSVADLAEAVTFLMANAYTTGLVLDIDGGHRVRQYATR
ncbi:MAG: SDR family oxidoreductase [Pseudomonadota bacterium]